MEWCNVRVEKLGISSDYYSNNQNFGHKIVLDIGASNKKGSMKLLALTDNNIPIFKQKGFVNDTIQGFDGNEDFLHKLSIIIKKAQEDILNLKNSGKLKLSAKDMLLSGLAIFVPGTTYTNNGHDKIAFMPNLRDKNNEALADIDFDQFKEDIKNGTNDFEGLKASEDFALSVTKDLGGCGIALAKLLSKQGELNEGDYIMGVMTGGGFGSVDIKVKDKKVEFETSESSNYLSGNFESYNYMIKTFEDLLLSEDPVADIAKLKANNNEQLEKDISILGKIGRQGVSVKSHIKTFFNALDKHELGKIALKAGDARIVEDNFMCLDRNKDKEVIEEIKAYKEFVEIPTDKPEKIKFKLDEACFEDGKIKEARKIAVNSYANAVSLITINKINDCINKVILTGPFAHGVNRHIKENPEDYLGAKDLPELIMQKIKKNIDKEHADLPSTERLLKIYDLKIICDDKLNFDDNTFAGDILLNKKLKFVPNRGSWFSIPVKDLEKATKTNTKS